MIIIKLTVKDITYNAIIAALYIAITLLSIPISYGQLQFRISEILVLLVFFKKNYVYGICLGTMIANFGSTLSLWDVLFGTIATLLACLCIMFSKHLLLAIIFPVIFNGLIVGFELLLFVSGLQAGFVEFLVLAGWVSLGELAVMIVGYLLFMILKRRKDFSKIINGNQNIDFKF